MKTVRTPAGPARPPLLPLVGGGAAAVVLAIGLYALWGEPDGPTLANATALMADDDATPEALADLERVLGRPSGAAGRTMGDGWFYLAHLRMRSEDYAGAAAAFAALHELTGGNEQLDLTWAQAGFLAAGGVLDEATLEIVERVLGRRPEHPNMLELLAMDAIRRSSFADAAGFLDRALRQPLVDSRRALLDQTLNLVRGPLGRRETAHRGDGGGRWHAANLADRVRAPGRRGDAVGGRQATGQGDADPDPRRCRQHDGRGAVVEIRAGGGGGTAVANRRRR